MDINDILNTLNSPDYEELIHNMYLCSEEIINDKWKDEEKFTAYLKAYCIYEFLKTCDERQKGLFLLSLDLGFGFISVFTDFIEKINATEAKMADLINEDVLEDFKELSLYISNPIYKELSKSNKVIAKIIKEHHKYLTMEEIKSGKYLHSFCNPTGYKITGREIEMLDRARKFSKLNTLAHMLYDEKGLATYHCDHTIKNDKEILKKFLMNTSSNNPEYDIIFEDGTIINYFMGNIRVKPYNFQDVITYTKLFYAMHFVEMKEYFNIKDKQISVETAKQMVKSSFVNVIGMLYALEDVYTQKMIDDSKNELVKIKKIVKEYDL